MRAGIVEQPPNGDSRGRQNFARHPPETGACDHGGGCNRPNVYTRVGGRHVGTESRKGRLQYPKLADRVRQRTALAAQPLQGCIAGMLSAEEGLGGPSRQRALPR